MKNDFHINAARIGAFTGWLGVVLLTGCGSSGSSSDSASGSASRASVGQTLTMSDGTQFGTVGDAEGSQPFPDGTVEPGVLVDYSPRIPGQRNWMPTRSAARMTKGNAGGVASASIVAIAVI